MKNYTMLLTAISLMGLSACAPNLVPQSVTCEGSACNVANAVRFEIKNTGNSKAGPHLTYVEINKAGVDDALKPQSQHSLNVPSIPAGGSWPLPEIAFPDDFSLRHGLTVSDLTPAENFVIIVDAKNMVKESDEDDNVLDIDQ